MSGFSQGPFGGAFAQVAPTAPTASTTTTILMMGFGSTATITPTRTGKVAVTLKTTWANAASGSGATGRLQYGTGTAPSYASASTGTILGNGANFTAAANGQQVPVTLTGIITGLTVGTAAWVDLGFAVLTGSSASMSNVLITLNEVP